MHKLIGLMILTMTVFGSCAIADINVIKNGQSRYEIVVPNRQTKATDYAAHELQHFLKEISGVELPIKTESMAGGGPAFLIGLSSRVRNMDLSIDVDKLSDDGVFIRTVGNDIVMLGENDRGQLYSVYSLLECYLGVRFIADDCTVVPRQRIVTLPNIDYSYSPQFMYREVLSYDSFPKAISARLRLNGPYSKCDASVGGKILFYPFVHSSIKLLPPEKYFKEHPEYYGMIDGKRTAGSVDAQLCFTNPDVLKIATQQVFDWIKEHPEATSIDVSQNDGGNPCQCDKCTAVVKEEGSQHGPIMRFVNAIADAVAEKYPDMYIDTLAYAYATNPPAITKPHKNVIIRLCHTGCYFHGFEHDGMGAGLVGNINEWTKLSKHIFIWHYATNFGQYIAPNQNLNALAKDLKYYGSHGLNGVMVQCNYQGSGGELAELRTYLCSQLLWNPSRDPMAIRNEFCDGYYGSASKEAMEFLALMDKQAENTDKHVFANWNPCDTVTPEFVAQGLSILNRAHSNARSSKIANHIDKLLLPLWYMQLSWPDRYGLSSSDAPALLARFEKVVNFNNITAVREAYTVDKNGKWSDAPSMPGWISEMRIRYAPLSKGVVYSFLKEFDKAKCENCANWRTSSIERNGKTLVSIFMHPKPEVPANATYDIALPNVKTSQKLAFQFDTALTAESGNGVRFAILVNGEEAWSAVQQVDKDDISKSFVERSIDLSRWAGQDIKLTLQVDAMGDTSYDWANWVEPQIVVGK